MTKAVFLFCLGVLDVGGFLPGGELKDHVIQSRYFCREAPPTCRSLPDWEAAIETRHCHPGHWAASFIGRPNNVQCNWQKTVQVSTSVLNPWRETGLSVQRATSLLECPPLPSKSAPVIMVKRRVS